MHTISFPGLGIEPFTINSTAFTIFGIEIKWYAIIIVTGIILAFFYVYMRTRPLGLLTDDLLDIALVVVFPAIICARLYYVIFKELEVPGSYQTFLDVIDIRSGGLAIYGGIIGGAAFALLILKIKKIRLMTMFDALAPAVMIGQTLGRWGNFVNSEAYGGQTDLPWRMGVVENGEMIYVHPTFLYESLWNLLGLLIITVFYKKRKFDGQVFFFYFAWYGLGRMFIEGMRTDSLYIGSTGIRVSQLISGVLFVVAAFLLIFFTIRTKRPSLADNIYREDSKHFEDGREQIARLCEKRAQKEAARGEKGSGFSSRLSVLFKRMEKKQDVSEKPKSAKDEDGGPSRPSETDARAGSPSEQSDESDEKSGAEDKDTDEKK